MTSIAQVALRLPTLAALFGLIGCVIETEPAPRRPLLRDVLRARQAAVPVAADAAPPPPRESAPAAPHDALPSPPPPPEAFRACKVDSDCVAVTANGCCRDGRNEPINKGLVEAYRSSFVCPVATPTCPEPKDPDRRVPSCDSAAHLCTLVPAPPAP